jgi:transposase
MGSPLSVDLRKRVVAAYKRGEGTQVEIAERFGVGEASVRRWVRRDRETGDVMPKTDFKHGPAPKIEMANMAVLEELLAANKDATNAELAELMEERTGISVSASTISRSIAILGWTRKKSASSPQKPIPRVSAIFVQSGPRGRRG